MNLEGFKKAITQSIVKNVIIGSGIFLFGVFIIWLILSGADPEMEDMSTGGIVVLYILGGIALFFGFLITFQQVRVHLQSKKGEHPIVKAIEKGDKQHLIWIYEHITQVQGGGSDHQVHTYDHAGNKLILSLKKKRIPRVITYLQEQFPEAIVGYSEGVEKGFLERFN